MNFQPRSDSIKHTPIEAVLPKIKVVGLGGGGCNAINRMIAYGMTGVEFIACNTDKQVLSSSLADNVIQLGPKCTKGLGAGGIPSIGEKAAEESFQTIADALEDADMVFLAAGMGGGTGTGAIPVAARVSKSVGAVTIAVVTTPFSFEMGRRQKNAAIGLHKLRQYTDTLITVPNDRLLKVAPEDLSLDMAFKLADDVLRQGISGIAELITESGLINVDFAHIRHVMKLGGGALMAIGTGEGEGKALKALENALHHPLLDDIELTSANGIIANFSGGDDLTFAEVTETLTYLHGKTKSSTEIIPGVINDSNLSNRAQVILIVTGLGAMPIENAIPGAEKYFYESSTNTEKQKVSAEFQRNRYEKQEGEEPVLSSSNSFYQSSPAVVSSDLDVPAFLRKRIRG